MFSESPLHTVLNCTLKNFMQQNWKYSKKEAYDKMYRTLGRNLICKFQKQKKKKTFKNNSKPKGRYSFSLLAMFINHILALKLRVLNQKQKLWNISLIIKDIFNVDTLQVHFIQLIKKNVKVLISPRFQRNMVPFWEISFREVPVPVYSLGRIYRGNHKKGFE